MNLIIGSGLIGMLARHILGDNYEFITQKRSRYFSFDPILADNYIIRNKVLDEIIEPISPLALQGVREYKRPFSFSGQLMYNENDLTIEPYLSKVYGDPPDHAHTHMKTSFWVYNLTAKAMHDRLQDKLSEKIITTKSEVISINLTEKKIDVSVGDTEKRTLEYDNIISTVPLNVLCKWVGTSMDLDSRSICYYHIKTDSIDLEGADESLVVDPAIEFFKVTSASEPIKFGFSETKKNINWLFWTFDHVDNPHNYFGLYLGYKFDIIDASQINEAIPIGPKPDLAQLEKYGVYCVGSNAQWDDFMDIASCANRLLKLREILCQ